jgi:hypothetical protein
MGHYAPEGNSHQLTAISPARRTAGLNVDVTVVDHSQTSHQHSCSEKLTAESQ